MPSDSQCALIAQAVSGNSLPLQQLLVRHFTPLERYVSSRIPGDLRALVAGEDVMQDAFSQAVRDIVRFQGAADAEFFAWPNHRRAPFG